MERIIIFNKEKLRNSKIKKEINYKIKNQRNLEKIKRQKELDKFRRKNIQNDGRWNGKKSK